MNVERRKSERHRVPDSTLFIFDHDTSQMAVIKDINMNGLQFQYFQFSEDCKAAWEIVDIFGSGPKRLHLLGIPCQLIYNQNSLAENHSVAGPFTRTGGLKFGQLTAAQQKKLASAIAIIDVHAA